jgi:pimeloyl-ACP methyl ester carboxylesterase
VAMIKTKDGIEIYYKDWGKGQPVVFSHGWPLSADDWDAQMLFFLNHRFRVIAHEPARPWPIQPDQRRPRHGSLCRRSRGGDGAS